jgi:uroporphyrinogen-III synthase
MKNHKPLRDETIIFTGTPKSTDVFKLVEKLGGRPVSYPLIRVQDIEQPTDVLRLESCHAYDWLIFTSQSAVSSFHSKMKRFGVLAEAFTSKIAAIGTRTAAALEQIGFSVDFIPTIFSADVFVNEFNPVESPIERILFLRGSMAGVTIPEGLPFTVDEWTIYETIPFDENAKDLIEILQMKESATVIFASPSAVRVFANQVVPHVGWTGYTIGAIGHVTERALIEQDATVHVKPETYTLKDLVEALAKRKEVF